MSPNEEGVGGGSLFKVKRVCSTYGRETEAHVKTHVQREINIEDQNSEKPR